MIKYKARYKYRLVEPYQARIPIYPLRRIRTEYLELGVDGVLTIKAGYAWDGPSGPAIDTRTFMRGSLVHDALYQLIRIGELPPDVKPTADKLLRQMCIEDGMNRVRAAWVYWGVRLFAKRAITRAAARPVLTAP